MAASPSPRLRQPCEGAPARRSRGGLLHQHPGRSPWPRTGLGLLRPRPWSMHYGGVSR